MWHNRNRRGGYGTLPRTAFTTREEHMIDIAMGKLYKRALYWTYTSKVEFPPDLVHSMYPVDMWDKLHTADKIVGERYSSTIVTVGDSLHVSFNKIGLLPDSEQPAVLPESILAYGVNAKDLMARWLTVEKAAKATLELPRVAAAYYWPCLAALMKLGKVEDTKLATVTSYNGNSPKLAGLDRALLRDTASYVASCLMLPEVPTIDKQEQTIEYKISAIASHPNFVPAQIWPI